MISLHLCVGSDGTVGARLTGAPRLLVFDVETDGGSPKQRCIEMAFLVLDGLYREVHRYCAYWRLPSGASVSPHAQRVHGITDATLALRGVDPRGGLLEFMAWVDRVLAHEGGCIVAHNAAFDTAVVAHMLAACGVARAFGKDDCFCTMRGAAPHARCVDKNGKRRAPQNAELYAVLHGGPPTWAKLHAALDDVRVTARNFEAGRARGWW